MVVQEFDDDSVTEAAQHHLPLAVLLLGPTGSGKTALALKLGEHIARAYGSGRPEGAEIVSCDSVAVYRGMDLGSAKPSREEQLRLPHHLIDVTDPDQPFTAGEYSRQARAAMRAIAGRNRLPVVTGGTGLYLRALTLGLFAGPTRNEDLRARLVRSDQRHQGSWLHRLLTRLDPVSASRIHANDTPKLLRALEVSLTAGRSMSEALATGRDPLTGFRLLRIGLNPKRLKLYDRLNCRAEVMFSAGLVEETRGLLERFGAAKAFDALGYRQARAVITGEMTEAEAITATQQGHRNYAKRQLTWFRREPDVHWIEDFGDTSAAFDQASGLVATHL